jgi:hypothetical protein
MSVLLLFPQCPVHSNPQVKFGDSPSGNLAAPPVPPTLAGAAFSLPRERGSYRRRDACVFPAGLPDTREESRALLPGPRMNGTCLDARSLCGAAPDTREESRAFLLAETVSVLLGLWIAECALLLLFMGYVR